MRMATLLSKRKIIWHAFYEKNQFFKTVIYLAVCMPYLNLLIPSTGHSGGTPLLQRILSNMMLCLQREAEFRAEDFNGRPGFRIILGFITEISISEKTNPASFDLLTTIATALLDVHPLLVPGFAFQWLEIISMRSDSFSCYSCYHSSHPVFVMSCASHVCPTNITVKNVICLSSRIIAIPREQ